MNEFETHNKRFELLENEYLKTRNPETLSKMYFLVKELQTNYIRKYERTHGFFFNKDDFEDKVEEATIFVIDKYLKHPEFKIGMVSAYAHYGLLKALFKDKDKEMALKTISIEDYLRSEATNLYEQDYEALFDEGQE